MVETGIVKFFLPARDYGFITPDEPGLDELFVHARALAASGISLLRKGDRVTYERVPDRRGFRAQRIALVRA